MEIQQYMSPRERDMLDRATADLDAFMAQMAMEDAPCKSVTKNTPTHKVNDLLDAYQDRLTDNVKDAELYRDVNVIPFTCTKMKAVIDWLDLQFTVDPTRWGLCNDPRARSYIKSFITRQTGIRHYVAADESHIRQVGTSFTIRLHDLSSFQDLKKITDLLYNQYGAIPEMMAIEAIELSLDLYGENSSAVLIKLHKAMKYPQDSKLFRVYKTKGTRRSIPTSLHKLYYLLEDGYNIGMGDHRSDDFCVRLYFKRTDKGGLALPKDEHRARIEVTLRKFIFDEAKIDRSLDNLKELVSWGFKKMQFTKLSRRSTESERDAYYTQVQAFGTEKFYALSRSRHKRNLPDSIEAHGQFNESKRLAVRALVKRF